MRRTPTEAERRIWSRLRNAQLGGLKFSRQVPIGPYIVDFACFERALIVELDGGQHAGSTHDLVRDAELRKRGFRILRFWNAEALSNTEGVLETIRLTAASHP